MVACFAQEGGTGDRAMEATLDIGFVHNTDLDPGERYLASLPRVRTVLRFANLIELFKAYDALANSRQAVLYWTGLTSLCLAAATLAGITTELLVAALQRAVPVRLVVLFEVGAVLAIALAVGPWMANVRNKWLTARFVTEQIRQWHFQIFLDGELISQATHDEARFEAIREARWAQFQSQAANAEGTMPSFADGANIGFHHPVSAYIDDSSATEAFQAYNDLRFSKQLAYFKLKRDDFAKREEWSEYVARWTLFSAVLSAAGQLLLVLLESKGFPTGHIRSWISAAVIGLLILNASVRVYQNGLQLSEQRERFDTKWVGLVSLKAQFDVALTTEQKLRVMRDVELLEVEELREFLKQMRRASFLL